MSMIAVGYDCPPQLGVPRLDFAASEAQDVARITTTSSGLNVFKDIWLAHCHLEIDQKCSIQGKHKRQLRSLIQSEIQAATDAKSKGFHTHCVFVYNGHGFTVDQNAGPDAYYLQLPDDDLWDEGHVSLGSIYTLFSDSQSFSGLMFALSVCREQTRGAANPRKFPAKSPATSCFFSVTHDTKEYELDVPLETKTATLAQSLVTALKNLVEDNDRINITYGDLCIEMEALGYEHVGIFAHFQMKNSFILTTRDQVKLTHRFWCHLPDVTFISVIGFLDRSIRPRVSNLVSANNGYCFEVDLFVGMRYLFSFAREVGGPKELVWATDLQTPPEFVKL